MRGGSISRASYALRIGLQRLLQLLLLRERLEDDRRCGDAQQRPAAAVAAAETRHVEIEGAEAALQVGYDGFWRLARDDQIVAAVVDSIATRHVPTSPRTSACNGGPSV